MWVLIITVLNSFNILNSKLLNLYQFVDTHSTGIFLYVRCLSGQPDADITLSRASHVYIYTRSENKNSIHQAHHQNNATTSKPHYQNNASTRQPHFRNNVSLPARWRVMRSTWDSIERTFVKTGKPQLTIIF